MATNWYGACLSNDLDVMKRYITRDNVNTLVTMDVPWTPLRIALDDEDVACVRWLVQDMGADVMSALAFHGHLTFDPDIVCILCAAGVNPNYMGHPTARTPLMDALVDYRVQYDDDLLRALVACGADYGPIMRNPGVYSAESMRALSRCVAARRKCLEAARALLYVGRKRSGAWRDVLVLVAKLVWRSRRSIEWEFME